MAISRTVVIAIFCSILLLLVLALLLLILIVLSLVVVVIVTFTGPLGDRDDESKEARECP